MKKLIFFLILALTQPLWAKELPLWEAGAGLLSFRANHYRGSPQNKWFFIPFPYYVVRGKNVEAENGYIRGHLAKFDKFTLDLSFSLGLNVDSDSDRLRKGMRNLDPTFELGPMLRYYMWKSQDNKHFVNFEMPYRAVYASNLRYLEHVGYYSIPYINYLAKGTEATWGWSTELSLGIQYGSSGFHNRFYAVDSQDVTPHRAYYHSASGYSGTQLSLTMSKRINDFLIIPFVRYDYLDAAVYKESPLYKNPNYTFFGVSVVWFFAKSEKPQTAPTMVK